MTHQIPSEKTSGWDWRIKRETAKHEVVSLSRTRGSAAALEKEKTKAGTKSKSWELESRVLPFGYGLLEMSCDTVSNQLSLSVNTPLHFRKLSRVRFYLDTETVMNWRRPVTPSASSCLSVLTLLSISASCHVSVFSWTRQPWELEMSCNTVSIQLSLGINTPLPKVVTCPVLVGHGNGDWS